MTVHMSQRKCLQMQLVSNGAFFNEAIDVTELIEVQEGTMELNKQFPPILQNVSNFPSWLVAQPFIFSVTMFNTTTKKQN